MFRRGDRGRAGPRARPPRFLSRVLLPWLLGVRLPSALAGVPNAPKKDVAAPPCAIVTDPQLAPADPAREDRSGRAGSRAYLFVAPSGAGERNSRTSGESRRVAPETSATRYASKSARRASTKDPSRECSR